MNVCAHGYREAARDAGLKALREIASRSISLDELPMGEIAYPIVDAALAVVGADPHPAPKNALDAWKPRPGGGPACMICGHQFERHETSRQCESAALDAIYAYWKSDSRVGTDPPHDTRNPLDMLSDARNEQLNRLHPEAVTKPDAAR